MIEYYMEGRMQERPKTSHAKMCYSFAHRHLWKNIFQNSLNIFNKKWLFPLI